MSKSTALSVNINKIALIRNSRETTIPDLVEHAQICINAGADGITVHPRPDQRHIRATDCYDIAKAIDVEFNIEGNPFAEAEKSARSDVGDYPGFMDLVRDIKPTQCTLVPDSRNQLTSNAGFDLEKTGDSVAPIVQELQSIGIRVSLFMDPIEKQIKLAKEIGASRIELYTGPYAETYGTEKQMLVFERFKTAADVAADIGLGLNAGHDLNLDNLSKFTTIRNLMEVSIGHALIVDALSIGLSNAVKAYRQCLRTVDC